MFNPVLFFLTPALLHKSFASFITKNELYNVSALFYSPLTSFPLMLLCSLTTRWSPQMTIHWASAPVSASRPSAVSVQGVPCPHAHQDWWGHQETLCHGTYPNMRGGRGRVRTRCWTRLRGQWFVLQVRTRISLQFGDVERLLSFWAAGPPCLCPRSSGKMMRKITFTDKSEERSHLKSIDPSWILDFVENSSYFFKVACWTFSDGFWRKLKVS